MITEFDVEELKVRVKYLVRFSGGDWEYERPAVQAKVYEYWQLRKAQGASKREVAWELGMKSHSMLCRWIQTHENRLARKPRELPKVPPSPISPQIACEEGIMIFVPGKGSVRVTDPRVIETIAYAVGKDIRPTGYQNQR